MIYLDSAAVAKLVHAEAESAGSLLLNPRVGRLLGARVPAESPDRYEAAHHAPDRQDQ
jgi:hypothetical protein